jgi:hypothetical protein
MVGDVAGGFGSGDLFLSVSHFQSPFYVSKLRQSRPDGTDRQDRKDGAERDACKAENWGRPLGEPIF